MPRRIPLKHLIEHDDCVWFTYGDGNTFEGWVLEVTDDALLVMWRSSPIYAMSTDGDEWSRPDEWIKITDIDMETIVSNNPLEDSEVVIRKPWWKFWA